MIGSLNAGTVPCASLGLHYLAQYLERSVFSQSFGKKSSKCHFPLSVSSHLRPKIHIYRVALLKSGAHFAQGWVPSAQPMSSTFCFSIFISFFFNHTSDIGWGARSQMLHVFNFTVFSCSSQINLYNSFANIISCFSLSAKCPSCVSILILLNSRSNSSAFPQI